MIDHKRKEQLSNFLALVLMVLFFGGIIFLFGSMFYQMNKEQNLERSREYQLVCSGGFTSAWGERPWSYDRTNKWGTPSGTYAQLPGETCQAVYRERQ